MWGKWNYRKNIKIDAEFVLDGRLPLAELEKALTENGIKLKPHIRQLIIDACGHRHLSQQEIESQQMVGTDQDTSSNIDFVKFAEILDAAHLQTGKIFQIQMNFNRKRIEMNWNEFNLKWQTSERTKNDSSFLQIQSFFIFLSESKRKKKLKIARKSFVIRNSRNSIE